MNQTETKKRKHHKGLWITLGSILFVLILLLAVFFGYVSQYNHATEEAKTYLVSDEKTTVKQEKKYITFTPKEPSENGFIFYPGGKVEETAYAPMMKELSDQGISGVLLSMPFHLAVFDSNAAEGKKDLFPSIKHWYLGGHSLGGAMVSSYLSKHSDEYDGLILLAAYSTQDMSMDSFRTLSLLASNDQVLKKDKYQENKKHLPNLTEYSISGGIHSYFGDYGIQKGDGTPAISVNDQRKEVVSQITDFIF